LNEKTSRRADVFGAGALVLAFCGLLLRHNSLLFWNDDYEISILPVFADVARSWSEGHVPLLSPYSWVCGNLAGEFQYGTFSIFVNTAVVLIWRLPLAFAQQTAALSLAHLFVLAAGAFLLARARNLSPPLATMVALVAALNGWIRQKSRGRIVLRSHPDHQIAARRARAPNDNLPALVVDLGRDNRRDERAGFLIAAWRAFFFPGGRDRARAAY
jgi:hypothetical protein